MWVHTHKFVHRQVLALPKLCRRWMNSTQTHTNHTYNHTHTHTHTNTQNILFFADTKICYIMQTLQFLILFWHKNILSCTDTKYLTFCRHKNILSYADTNKILSYAKTKTSYPMQRQKNVILCRHKHILSYLDTSYLM